MMNKIIRIKPNNFIMYKNVFRMYNNSASQKTIPSAQQIKIDMNKVFINLTGNYEYVQKASKEILIISQDIEKYQGKAKITHANNLTMYKTFFPALPTHKVYDTRDAKLIINMYPYADHDQIKMFTQYVNYKSKGLITPINLFVHRPIIHHIYKNHFLNSESVYRDLYCLSESDSYKKRQIMEYLLDKNNFVN